MKIKLFGMAFVVLALVVMLATAQGFAATKTLTFKWDKPVIEPDLYEFELQYSTDAVWSDYVANSEPDSGVWNPFCKVPYTEDQTEYIQDHDLMVEDNTDAVYYFRVRAVDDAGNSSGWCYGDSASPCKADIDLASPDMTINFTVVIKTKTP